MLGSARNNTLVYMLRPEPPLNAVKDACTSWPAGAMHQERCATKPQADQPAPKAAALRPGIGVADRG